MSIPHCTVYLETIRDECNQTISLNWNSYTNWSSGVQNYEVLYKVNGGNFISHSTVTGYTQTISNVNPNSLYCIFIKAVSTNLKDTSFSNQTCIYTSYPFVSDTNYLQNVSVKKENQIEIKIYTPLYNTINGYKINRSDDGINFTEVGSVSRSPNPTVYIDNGVTSNTNSYIYNITPYDSCDNATNKVTNIGGNILLEIDNLSDGYISKLKWKQYQNWNGGVSGYNIYRILGNTNPTIISTVNSSEFNYEDDISQFYSSSSDGQFCYYIQAIENINQFGIAELSNSNKVCVKPQEIIYIPNSFSPMDKNGLNDLFRPIIGFANYNEYSFKIYNRLGQLIFETNDIQEGWNGKYKGYLIHNEVLIYELLIETSDGQPIKRNGHVSIF